MAVGVILPVRPTDNKNKIPVIEGYRVCRTKEEVWDAICAIGDDRGTLGYDIDGAVVKLKVFAPHTGQNSGKQ